MIRNLAYSFKQSNAIFRSILLTAIFFVSFIFTAYSQKIVGGQLVINLPTTTFGDTTQALLSLPGDYDSTTAHYPLIVFLHGSGEAGTVIDTLLRTALPMRIADGLKMEFTNPKDKRLYKFIVVSPQAPSWSYQETHVKCMLPVLISRYRIDTNRIYITGLSAGGYGTWTGITDDTAFCKRLAAIVPISAATLENYRTPNIKNAAKYGIPVWEICGTADAFYDSDKVYVDTYINKNRPIIPGELTSLVGVGHSAWDQGYDPTWSDTTATGTKMNVYQWMLQYTRGGVPDSSGTIIGCGGKKRYITKGGDNGATVNGTSFIYSPGDTLTFKFSSNPYSYFNLSNIHGTPTCPVTITNEGGQVKMSTGMSLVNCTYIKIAGTGSSDKYGFHIEDTAASAGTAISISGRFSNVEVNNIDVHKKVYGVVAQQTASCADSLQYPNWRINNLNIHDNRIIKTKWEGLYIGSNDPNGTTVLTCSGKSVSPKPLRLSNITIKNNIIDSVNRSGIQLSSADSGTNNIDSNQISDIGLEFVSGMGNGITLGGYTTANVYDNTIIRTYYNGIQALGAGMIRIDSNTITNSGVVGGDTAKGANGIYVDTRYTSPVDSSLLKVVANNISGYTGYGIGFYKTYNTYGSNNLICSNTGTINVAPGITWNNCPTICGGKKRYITKGVDNGATVNGASFIYSPGDTLTFKFSSNPYSYFNLSNIHGTPTCPVTITNEGGQVKMSTGMSLFNCTYIKIAGTGSIDKYGFRIEDTVASSGIALNASGRCSNMEVNNIDVHKKQYGIVIKQDASCVDSFQYPKGRISNLNIHDNRIIKTKWEGLYIGSNDPNGTAVLTCSGKSVSPKPLRLSNITIKNNIIDSVNRSGIQLCSADSGINNIDSNQISDIGLEFVSGMGNGITLGGYTTANVYDNTIARTYYNGIQALGAGMIRIDSNTITSSGIVGGDTVKGTNGIYVDTRYTSPVDSSLLKVIGNSISGYTGFGVGFYKTYNTYSYNNTICHNTGNLSVAPGINWDSCSGSGARLEWPEDVFNNEDTDNPIRLYPNPSKGILHLQYNQDISDSMSFDIYNVEGRLMKSGTLKGTSDNQQTIDINSLVSGFYYLQLTNEKHRFVLKFIKEKVGI